MSYYSELAINDAYHENHSYPSPELQLKWRIEDLRSRLEDICAGNYGITARAVKYFVCVLTICSSETCFRCSLSGE